MVKSARFPRCKQELAKADKASVVGYYRENRARGVPEGSRSEERRLARRPRMRQGANKILRKFGLEMFLNQTAVQLVRLSRYRILSAIAKAREAEINEGRYREYNECGERRRVENDRMRTKKRISARNWSSDLSSL